MKTIDVPCINYALATDLYEGTGSGVWLVLIGLESNRKRMSRFYQELSERTGKSVVVFDYTGHGDSPLDLKDCTPAQHMLESVEVYDWILQNVPNANNDVSVMGSSYGGFFAALISDNRQVQDLILRVPALYHHDDFYKKWRDMDREWTRNVYRKDRASVGLNPLFAHPPRYHGDCLVIRHELDEACPKEVTDKYLEAYKAQELYCHGLQHAVSMSGLTEEQTIAYEERILHWITDKEVA